jgi:DNA segregation ATPase FtsK/SpoIIIE-like protein
VAAGRFPSPDPPPAGDGLVARPFRLVTPLLALSLLLSSCALAGVGVSEAGRQRCRNLAAASGPPLLGPWRELRCLPGVDKRLASEAAQERRRREQAQQRLQADLARCRQQRQPMLALVTELRRTRQTLADQRLEAYTPAPRPQPPDEELEARYRPEDQELDRERYEAALAAWREAESQRRRRWEARHRARRMVLEAQQQQQLAELRRRNPALLKGDALQEQAVSRYSQCRAQDFLKADAPPVPAGAAAPVPPQS